MEPTYKQFKILEDLNESGRKGFNNPTDDHWELVRNKYIKNFVSFGKYLWIFEITEQGIDYLKSVKS